MHGLDAAAAVRREFLDEVRLGQILPVFLGHLGLHHFQLEPGGVENIPIVNPPRGFERVGILHRILSDAGGEREHLTDPVHAAFGRENAPVHVCEPLPEKRCTGLDDCVVRLEPGGVALTAGPGIRIDQLEAHEGMHLVNFPADVLLQRAGLGHVRIAGDGE